jgi:hypothetical protein
MNIDRLMTASTNPKKIGSSMLYFILSCGRSKIDLNKLKAFLEAGADPNESIGVFVAVPPLIYAFHLRNLEVFQVLFQSGADVLGPFNGMSILESMACETYEHFLRMRTFSEEEEARVTPEQWELRCEEFFASRAILRWCIQSTNIENLIALQKYPPNTYSLLTWVILIEDKDLAKFLLGQGFPIDFRAPPIADPKQQSYFRGRHNTYIAQENIASFLGISFPLYTTLAENWNARTYQYFKALLKRDRLYKCLQPPLPTEIWMEILRRIF